MQTLKFRAQGSDCWMWDGRYSEVYAQARTRPATVNIEKWQTYEREMGGRNPRPAFYGGIATDADLRQIMERGWPSGAQRALALKRDIETEVPPPVRIGRRRQWSDDGDTLSVDRLYASEVDTMWARSVRVPVLGPSTIAITCSWGGMSERTPEQLFWTVAPLLALTDLAEAAGYRVEAHAVSCVSIARGRLALMRVQLKGADEAMTPDVLASVAHAGTFRGAGFRVRSHCPYLLGAGLAVGVTLASNGVLRAMAEQGLIPAAPDIHLPYCYSRDAAVAALREAMAVLTARTQGAAR